MSNCGTTRVMRHGVRGWLAGSAALWVLACTPSSDVCGNTRCGDTQRCVSGTCRLECNTNTECPQNQLCEGGVCLPTAAQGSSSGSSGASGASTGSSSAAASSSSGTGACQRPVTFPVSGWEVRQHALGPGNTVGDCVAVVQSAAAWLDDTQVQAAPSGATTGFVLRFTGRRTFVEGVSRFMLTHDDGVRVFVDGMQVYAMWSIGTVDQATASTPPLSAGPHDVTVEYFQDTGARTLTVLKVDGCGPLRAPPNAWDVQVHSLQPDGGVGTCLLNTQLATDALHLSDAAGSVFPQVPANGVRVTARGLRTLRGVTGVNINHVGAASLTMNDTPVYSNAAPETVQVPVYLAGDALLDVMLEDAGGPASLDLELVNPCDAPPSHPTIGWDVHYHRAVQVQGVWSLRLDDCLGAESLAGNNLDQPWSGQAPALVMALGIMDRWGGILRARRTYAGATTVEVFFDDGLRVYVGDESTPRLDRFVAPNVETAMVAVPGGGTNVRLEYFQAFGGSGLRFTAP